MKRTIFVGSSHEGKCELEQICAALRACDALKGSDALQSSCDAKFTPKKWTEVFKPGLFNFEALEVMLTECCGGVFVIRRDDVVWHHEPSNEPTYMPRGNVLVEIGLVAGRLGRKNIALCVFDKTELPSDLNGMTVIPVDREITHDDGSRPVASAINHELVHKLDQWASQLLATAEGIPRTEVFHGYTGRWWFEVQLSLFRGILIKEPSHAMLHGYFDLLIFPEGGEGSGYADCTLAFLLEPSQDRSDSVHQRYEGAFHIVHELLNIGCKADGTIEFDSQRLGIQENTSKGEAWPELHDLSQMSEQVTYNWVLNTTNRPRQLTGKFSSSVPGRAEGQITAKKLGSIH